MFNELRTFDIGEYDGIPTPTGRVYILMHSNVTSVPHTFVKQHKTNDLQTIIDTGILNYNEMFNVDVNYKLLSGDSLLINKYNHIVGVKKESNDN